MLTKLTQCKLPHKVRFPHAAKLIVPVPFNSALKGPLMSVILSMTVISMPLQTWCKSVLWWGSPMEFIWSYCLGCACLSKAIISLEVPPVWLMVNIAFSLLVYFGCELWNEGSISCSKMHLDICGVKRNSGTFLTCITQMSSMTSC